LTSSSCHSFKVSRSSSYSSKSVLPIKSP